MTKAFSDYVKKAMAKAGKVQYRRKGRKFPNWVKESDVPGIIALEQMGPEQRFYVLIIRSWRSSAADALRTIEQRELPRVFLDSYYYETLFDTDHYREAYQKYIDKHDNCVAKFETFFGPLPEWV